MRVILCGLPGCGKTSIGQAVAAHFDWPFFDTDGWIESQYGSSCRDLFNTLGEEAYRKLETDSLVVAKELKQGIISLGGGTLTKEKNCQLAKSMGMLIYLQCDVSRLKIDPEAAFLRGKTLSLLAKERVPIFEMFADETIPPEKKALIACIKRSTQYGE